MIHLAHRRRRPAVVHPVPDPPSTPAFELALTVQAMLQADGQSLHDPATAQAFATTLQAVLLLVDGAHAQGILGEEQWQAMRVMLDDMRAAPDLV
ncbi:hypothetical protein [Streptomyces sp. NPDC056169]|uniref:hypothetical protein n=1 Tax=Streptomyces sp. NPDC056169 TaxID=3345734 RepID=UPI0035D56CE1